MQLRLALQIFLSLLLFCGGMAVGATKSGDGKNVVADSHASAAVTLPGSKNLDGDDDIALGQQASLRLPPSANPQAYRYQQPSLFPSQTPAIRAPPALS